MSDVPVGITMGDPVGIGPEIVAKLFAEGLPAPCLVIGDAASMRRAVATIGASLTVHSASNIAEAVYETGTMTVLQAGEPPGELEFGVVSARAGASAYSAIQRAIDCAQDGSLCAIVTAPVHKEALHAAGIAHPGHTEMLAARAGTHDYGMMLANDDLRVLLVTIHVPLAEAIREITLDAELKTIRLAHMATRRFGVAQARVAAAGLNPHAGEGGMFGREDLDVIAPAILRARGGH